jgi:integrase
MGALYKRRGSRNWMMAVTVAGKQICRSSHTSNKRLARKLLSRWETEVFEGRFQLIKTHAPTLIEWADQFLQTIPHQKTRSRYTSSVNNLKPKFGKSRLFQITPDLIDDFKDERLAQGVWPATVNRDLAVLRRMLKIAERKRFITRSPFAEVEFLEERSTRRRPHIVTFDEEDRILAVAKPNIHALAVVLLETGLRPYREALVLKWADVDFVNDSIRVIESKTQAGIRTVPMSGRCKAELQRWQNQLGPQFSSWVFPNMRDPGLPLKNIRRSWANTLKAAKIEYFWIYHLRHTFSSRLSAAGISDLFVAQMIGHSSPSIVQTYARAIDEHKRDAIRKLESLRPKPQPSVSSSTSAARPN